MGGCDDEYVEMWGGEIESFEIYDGEQLIGAELHYGKYRSEAEDYFYGMRWLYCNNHKKFK
jgi:hypothetical protein